MNLTLVGGTEQQRAWVHEALARCVGVDWDALIPNDVSVVWDDEPPCPGHKESACTQTDGSGNSIITIRNNLDDPAAWPEGKAFYIETVVHEFCHILTFTHTTLIQRQTMCPWFFYDGGEGDRRNGTADDLQPLEKAWGDRIVECMAEVAKDTLLPDQYRASDNRTNWKIDPGQFDAFMGALSVGTPTGALGEKTIAWFSTIPYWVGGEGVDLDTNPLPALWDADFGTVKLGGVENLSNPDPSLVKFRLRYGASAGDSHFIEYNRPDPFMPEGSAEIQIVQDGPWFLDPDTSTEEDAVGFRWESTLGTGGGGGEGFFGFWLPDEAVWFEWPPAGSPPVERDWSVKIPFPWAASSGPWMAVTEIMPLVDPGPGKPPPWPYTDPELQGGGSDVGVFRL